MPQLLQPVTALWVRTGPPPAWLGTTDHGCSSPASSLLVWPIPVSTTMVHKALYPSTSLAPGLDLVPVVLSGGASVA